MLHVVIQREFHLLLLFPAYIAVPNYRANPPYLSYVAVLKMIYCIFFFFENLAHAVAFFFVINLLKPTGYVMHQQFNIQQLYALSTLYLCVLYLSENKQRLVPRTA